VLQPLDAVPRAAGARQLVALVREAHHHRRLLQVLERAEHLLAAARGGRAPVDLALDQHQRRLDPADVRDGRARGEVGRLLEGRAAEPARVKSVKSAVYHQRAQSEIERCDTAAAKRSVCVIVQLVSTPPPLPPVTPERFESTTPRLISSSTPAIRSL
jgi:hypothetical protein